MEFWYLCFISCVTVIENSKLKTFSQLSIFRQYWFKQKIVWMLLQKVNCILMFCLLIRAPDAAQGSLLFESLWNDQADKQAAKT